MDERELQAIGLKKMDEFVPVPEEWKSVGYKEVKGKKGTYQVVSFERPNEPLIELWSHSMELRNGTLFARRDHIERQAEEARKGK